MGDARPDHITILTYIDKLSAAWWKMYVTGGLGDVDFNGELYTLIEQLENLESDSNTDPKNSSWLSRVRNAITYGSWGEIPAWDIAEYLDRLTELAMSLQVDGIDRFKQLGDAREKSEYEPLLGHVFDTGQGHKNSRARSPKRRDQGRESEAENNHESTERMSDTAPASTVLPKPTSGLERVAVSTPEFGSNASSACPKASSWLCLNSDKAYSFEEAAPKVKRRRHRRRRKRKRGVDPNRHLDSTGIHSGSGESGPYESKDLPYGIWPSPEERAQCRENWAKERADREVRLKDDGERFEKMLSCLDPDIQAQLKSKIGYKKASRGTGFLLTAPGGRHQRTRLRTGSKRDLDDPENE